MGTKSGILTGWVALANDDTQDHEQELDLDAVTPDEDPTDLED